MQRRRERERQTEGGKREKEKTASLVLPNNDEILQNILFTIFTKNPTQHKLVSEILSKMPCAFNCGGLNSDFVSL